MLGLGRNKAAKSGFPSLAVAKSESLQHAASTLIANIRFSSVDAPIRSIVFTGSVPNEGKTTAALATAIAIGQSGRKCLIVEGDMRRSCLRGVLGVHPAHGLHAVLTERCSVQDAICSTSLKNVFFLDAESGIPNPDTVLASSRFRKLLALLGEKFRYVIIDTPPVAAFPDAALVASVADATLLVVREGRTNKRDILYSLELLKNADANILGTVLNGLKQDGGGYGYGYGYYNNYYSSAHDDLAQNAEGAADQAQSAHERFGLASAHTASTQVPDDQGRATLRDQAATASRDQAAASRDQAAALRDQGKSASRPQINAPQVFASDAGTQPLPPSQESSSAALVKSGQIPRITTKAGTTRAAIRRKGH